MSRFDPSHLTNYPTEPGVYLMKDSSGKVLYIGKAKNLKARLKSYFSAQGDGRAMIPFLLSHVEQIETILVDNEKEALLLENSLIKHHQPKYNALLKDDKTYVSLMINHHHPWPMIRLVRYKGKPKEKGLYFGPYTSAVAARSVFELLCRLFPLRQCSDSELKRRKRPCLLYAMHQCIAPCVGKCSQEEYHTFVQGAIDFLKGKERAVIKKIKEEMKEAANHLEFERAAALQKTLRQIDHVTKKDQIVVRPLAHACDALALYRKDDVATIMILLFREGKLIGSDHYTFHEAAGEEEELIASFLLQYYQRQEAPMEILLAQPLLQSKTIAEILSEQRQKKVVIATPIKGEKLACVRLALKNAKASQEQEKENRSLQEKILLDLAEQLPLNRYPRRIECFDISNISGSDFVGAAVAYTEAKRDAKRTRTFIIKGEKSSDEYSALKQMLTRHLLREKEEKDLPDLIMIDGAKGQLSTALAVFKELDIASVDLIALAKEEGRHDKGLNAEKILFPHKKEPLLLPPTSPLLFFLQQIRDATHDCAIHFHQKRRKKRTLQSSLDSLEGIGPIKKRLLLRHFGSVKRIAEASDEELLAIKGISKREIKTLRTLALKKT